MQNIELIKTAYDYLRKNGLVGIYKLSDIGNSIVAFGGDPKKKLYGCRSVRINKITGESELFGAWLPENEILLDNAIDIPVPKEYLYKEGT